MTEDTGRGKEQVALVSACSHHRRGVADWHSLVILLLDDIYQLILFQRELGLRILSGIIVECLCNGDVRHDND